MRPIRLELKGFTAFRESQEIDFEGLDLFAIAGPTGSGKSSILDAITYALFGYVERVGKQVSQLISQGQPRMAVTLEFAVDRVRYRVTRTTRGGKRPGTDILVERLEDGEWRQAGEGADRVREADSMIRRAIGLDYEAFTRSVLLPQGRFAEFLVGDAAERRKILTELLGLELFERLAKRAGELKRDAAAAADASRRLLDTEYAGVTEGAAVAAEEAAERAAERDAALEAAETHVRQVAERWARAEAEVRELSSLAADARQAGEVARRAAAEAEPLASQVDEAEAAAKRAARAAADAVKATERTSAALAKAEAEWGRARDLAALGVKAERLSRLRDEAAAVEAELSSAGQAGPKLRSALAIAERALRSRVADAEAAIEALQAANRAVDEATHADLVVAVRAGVKVGDACPVCGGTVATLPKTRAGQTLGRAQAALAKAEGAAATASQALAEAQAARDSAEREADEAEREASRLEKEAAVRRKELAALHGEVATALGGRLPADPAAAVADRLARLELLEASVEEAAAGSARAREAEVGAERERDTALGRVVEVRARLEGVAASGLLERAGRAAGRDLVLPVLPSMASLKDDAAAVAAAAGGLAAGLEALAAGLEELAERRGAGEADLLAEGQRVAGDLVGPVASLAELVDRVGEARRRAAAELATGRREAERTRERLANAGKLVEEISEQRRRSEWFDALAKELRADRIIAFLQLEAFQILAAAGSDHLATLSGGRYGLLFEEDEFFVIDTWNGEERRSARTLSGGETFLASLGLALALSEQVRSLSVTEKARLDSLFLDEGFGTLDPETLEVVVEAIEQLGGDGRMVGVITHVQELAIRLPARIDVEKSPRGSRLQTVT